MHSIVLETYPTTASNRDAVPALATHQEAGRRRPRKFPPEKCSQHMENSRVFFTRAGAQELFPLELRTTLTNVLVIVGFRPRHSDTFKTSHPVRVVDTTGLLGLLLLAIDGPHNLLGLLRGVALVADSEGVDDPWNPEEQTQEHVEHRADRLPAEQDCEGRTDYAEECSHVSSTAGR